MKQEIKKLTPIEWWYNLPEVSKKEYSLKYSLGKSHLQVTGKEIDHIYLSENPQSKEQTQEETVKGKEVLDVSDINGEPDKIRAILSENKALKDELESWKKENFDNVDMAAQTIKELQESNRELVDALKPFANMFGELTEEKVRQGGKVYEYNKASFTVADLFAAYNAINPIK